jgi:hypothetical protein
MMERKMTHGIQNSWLVEETDFRTGTVKFSREYSSYSEAIEVYNNLKRVDLMNTIVIHKKEKQLLQE